ncbi:MAG: hydroxylamine reductase [Desulforegulaceae bacterium]|nr:hydroxylamine reductase [Desulforegulaceae bacterium]
MFCFQCQETAKNQGCTKRGVCGKSNDTSNLQDLLIHSVRGMCVVGSKAELKGDKLNDCAGFAAKAMFSTITNANFDNDKINALTKEAISRRDALIKDFEIKGDLPESAKFSEITDEKAATSGILSEENPDIRSLRETITIGLKGICAYYEHANILGYFDEEISKFIIDCLSATEVEKDGDKLLQWLLKTGEFAVTTMAILDKANTETYGNPEITQVNIGAGKNPGILISGHDLKDMENLLKQTEGTGVDVYTHGEMLPANYYPAFKKYEHFVGNYGNAWWKQNEEFESFNGAILMTTNCIIPVKDSYKDRIFTTGMTGYPGLVHIEKSEGKEKDFSAVIECAKKCKPPVEIETGTITGGFGHHQTLALADKIVEAVKSGAIKKFVIMAGCDGRMKSREYFTDMAKALPKDTVILTAGCAKYRYNKLNLGDIGGIPRVLDAGQCNDSYSLAVIALKLKEVFGAEDINDLPIDYAIGWYEQKAVTVLLALLHLGFKGVRIGPTLPGFLSENVAKTLIDTFGLKKTTDVETDLKDIMG